jgi:hypothetical protein
MRLPRTQSGARNDSWMDFRFRWTDINEMGMTNGSGNDIKRAGIT